MQFCSYHFDKSGNNLASQAAYEGSIPFARSSVRAHNDCGSVLGVRVTINTPA